MKLIAPNLSALPHIRHGFFTRQGGVSTGIYQSLNCGWRSGDHRENVAANRQRIADELDVPADRLITAHQVHSAKAVIADDPSAANTLCDGFVTTQRHLALGVLAADCAPILLADRTQYICAALHAGWRGAVAGISDAVVEQMQQCGAKNIIAAIGPHISAAVYQTGQDMRDEACSCDSNAEKFFTPNDDAPNNDSDHFYFDLGGYLAARLALRGVSTVSLGGCTLSAPERFFSYRASRAAGDAHYGRQLSAILLAE